MASTTLEELIVRGPVTTEGSLTTRRFGIKELEVEAEILHATEGLELARKTGIPGQIMAYEGQIAVAQTAVALSKIDFPEIVGIDGQYLGWHGNSTPVIGVVLSNGKPRHWWTLNKERCYIAINLASYNRPMPLTCLESYQNAVATDMFSDFQVWERVKNSTVMRHAIDFGLGVSSFKKVETDPYLVGVVRYRVDDLINEPLDEGGPPRTVAVATSRYFLIDRWDEIEPMP